MNNVNKCKMLLSSLSVFRGIMNRSVPKAFYELLLSLDKKPEEFLGAYGKLCSMLCERGCADKFAFAISETALLTITVLPVPQQPADRSSYPKMLFLPLRQTATLF